MVRQCDCEPRVEGEETIRLSANNQCQRTCTVLLTTTDSQHYSAGCLLAHSKYKYVYESRMRTDGMAT